MRTSRRRHRLTRRQSEQVLDGLGGHGGLTRLLADARPLRVTGELPGEAAAVAAFRSAAVEAPNPQPRSSSVRTLSLRRSHLVKVIAIATASVAIGGAAVAAGGHFPAPPKTAPVASGTDHPTTDRARAASVVGGGESDELSTPGSPPTARPTGLPTGPRTAPPISVPGHGDPPQTLGLCRAWAEAGKDNAGKLTRSDRFRELASTAGGSAKVTEFCENAITTWCEAHRWPGPRWLHVQGTQVVLRCVRPTGLHPHVPTSSDPMDHPNPARPGGQGSGEPTLLPSAGPARN